MAKLMTLPEHRPPGNDEEFEIDHFYCCDENVALCGEDLTGVEEVGDDSENPVCPLCQLVVESGRCPRCWQ